MLSHLLHGSKDAKETQEQSLTTILNTHDERSELTLLISRCTESMRHVIVDAFDPKQAGKPSDVTAKLGGDQAASNPNIDVAKLDKEILQKQRDELEKREKELSEPKMQELKEAALKFFDGWHDDILARVGQALNEKPEEVEKEAAEASAAQPTPPPKPEEKKISKTEPEDSDELAVQALRKLYPPIKTPLTELPLEKKALVLHSILLLTLSLEHYSAHSRILLLHLTSSLQLPLRLLTDDEAKLAKVLLKVAKDMSADEETKKRAEQNHDHRKWKVGLAAVAGAALIGVTGGLAAPLVAAGVGTVIEGLGLGATAAAGYLGAMASSSVVVGGLFGAYGGRMTGKMMDEYAREVEDFAFVPIRVYHRAHKIEELRRLRVAIGISGWLTEKEDVLKPWRLLGDGVESFGLRWELEALLNLGNALSEMMTSAAWAMIRKEIIKRTVFASLLVAAWPMKLLKISKLVDNPFSVGLSLSQKAGLVLADALINRAQGERPVTLVGYSLGASVIYSCLISLAERKAFGLVESVVLLGSPVPSAGGDWRQMRSVVSGRLVNVYSENDYILAFLYRTSSIQFGVAGLQEVEGVTGVQNVNVSDIVSGHTRYRYLTGTILKKIGFEDVDIEEVEREEAELKAVEDMEEKERKKKEEEKKKAGKDDDAELTEMIKAAKKKSEQSYADWATDKLKQMSLKTPWGDDSESKTKAASK